MAITMKAARVNAGWTSGETADKLGITRSYYSRMETGKVKVRPVVLLAFCQLTGVSVDDIILPIVSTLDDEESELEE